MTPDQDYYSRNKEKRKILVADYIRRKRAAAIAILGGKCVRCGFDDARALQVDHVNGGGKKELHATKKGALYANLVIRSVLAGELKYQLLCANCNWIKRSENGEALGRPKRKN